MRHVLGLLGTWECLEWGGGERFIMQEDME